MMDQPQIPVAVEALKHLDALYNLARWLTHDPVEAEDLVQETYLRALRGAHLFRPGTNLRAWLFQILRNTFFTLYKRKGREPEVLDPEVLDGLSTMPGATGASQPLAGPADGTAGLDLTGALNRLHEDPSSDVDPSDPTGDVRADAAGPVVQEPVRRSRHLAVLVET